MSDSKIFYFWNFLSLMQVAIEEFQKIKPPSAPPIKILSAEVPLTNLNSP